MRAIDIGIMCYGRLQFLQKCIDSIITKTKTPYNLYVANSFCEQEPEIEEYLLTLLRQGCLRGVILIKGNVYSNAADLLYEHFLKSDPFVITDGDVVLPDINYCWLEYMTQVLQSSPRWAYLCIRASLENIGENDLEVQERTGRNISKEALEYGHGLFRYCPEFPKIGLKHFTGVFFQTFNQSFYRQYLKRHHRFLWDHMIWRYAKHHGFLWGSLLDDCLHLGWSTKEFYPQYLKTRDKTGYQQYVSKYDKIYVGIHYSIHKVDGSIVVGIVK